MSTTTDQLHHVTVTHTRDAEGEITSTHVAFECRGDRTSPCHQYPDCDCESYDEEHDDNHQAVPHDECAVDAWFATGCGETCYTDGTLGGIYDNPDRIPERSGPVDTEWDECIQWSWADEVSA